EHGGRVVQRLAFVGDAERVPARVAGEAFAERVALLVEGGDRERRAGDRLDAPTDAAAPSASRPVAPLAWTTALADPSAPASAISRHTVAITASGVAITTISAPVAASTASATGTPGRKRAARSGVAGPPATATIRWPARRQSTASEVPTRPAPTIVRSIVRVSRSGDPDDRSRRRRRSRGERETLERSVARDRDPAAGRDVEVTARVERRVEPRIGRHDEPGHPVPRTRPGIQHEHAAPRAHVSDERHAAAVRRPREDPLDHEDVLSIADRHRTADPLPPQQGSGAGRGIAPR